MQEEHKLLIEAISSLKQEHNPFKQYLFPIISAFFTALLGAGIAYFTFTKQESLKVEKEKITNANKWLLTFSSSFNNLNALRNMYLPLIVNNNPIERFLQIPKLIIKDETINEDLSSLVFISTNINKNPKKGDQIHQIDALARNYNNLLIMWKKQTELNNNAKEKLEEYFHNESRAELNEGKVIEIVVYSKIEMSMKQA